MSDTVSDTVSDSVPISVPIVGGPQCGGKIRMYTTDIKPKVWVGPKWLGDGMTAFNSKRASVRFPIELEYRNGIYIMVKDWRSELTY